MRRQVSKALNSSVALYWLYVLVCGISFLFLSCAGPKEISNEISSDKAIDVAKSHVIKYGYDVAEKDVEVIKVKDGLEKGPIRLVALFGIFGEKDLDLMLHRSYWAVHFYPKNGLREGSHMLDGGYTVLIDLYTEEVLLFVPR